MKRRNLFKMLGAGAAVVPFVGESKQEGWQVSIGEPENDFRYYSVDDCAFNRLWPTAEACGCSERFTRLLIERVAEETGRGEMVVANAFKSIMTRLCRPATIDQIDKIANAGVFLHFFRVYDGSFEHRPPPSYIKNEYMMNSKLILVSKLIDQHNSFLNGEDKAKVRELSGGTVQAFALDAWCKLHREGKI